jgi:hypothetical protein
LSLPRLGQETSDGAENENPGAEKAGKVLLVFFVGFLENAFFQVRTCQEETRTGYAHRCGQWAHMQQTQEVIAIFDFWPWNLECGWNAVFSCLLSKSRMFSSSEAQLCHF